MVEKEEIEILVSEDGEIEFSIKGIKGPGCHKIAKDIGNAIGIIKEMKNTSEYYEKPLINKKIEKKIE